MIAPYVLSKLLKPVPGLYVAGVHYGDPRGAVRHRLWPRRYARCFPFVPQPEGLASGGSEDQIGAHTRFRFHAMLIASRTVLHHHREVAAVMATYGMFLGGMLALAWVIA